ncbi:precorrin-3B synthase [Xanthobacter autotrophicus]|uniref:precorrin-3B synthase n=1 Tax=Xanthobacter autotrophicus TaxID=280 RepID=UPI0024A77544|nr:precorrin-3B synthase [Xanthobacter autotrophicus]MDI4658340.1 precorrin-3B synthase [Xanthobacter autotrophicus]
MSTPSSPRPPRPEKPRPKKTHRRRRRNEPAPARRGACPAFLAPMETGDGLILRLVPAEGAISPGQLRGLARAATALGNGMMEITARGSLQVRGLTAETVAPLQDAVLALGITPRLGLAIDISPLSGLDPREVADARPLAQRIQEGAAGLADKLGPKVSVVIDGGGAIGLGGHKADVRLAALRSGAEGMWSVTIGGGAPELLAEKDAAARALDALSQIAALGRRARATDLPGCAAAQGDHGKPLAPLGTFPLADGRFACGIGLPFGAGAANLFAALADAAEAAGSRDLRPATERVLLTTGLDAEGTRAFATEARRLGCLVAPDDPRAFIAACPGAPACICAHFPARDLAPLVAEALAPLLDGTVTVHLSACTKGCAHPAPATLTFVGMDEGIALVHEGAPSGARGPVLPVDALAAKLATLAGTPRLPGETGRGLLARMQKAGLLAGLWLREGNDRPMVKT